MKPPIITNLIIQMSLQGNEIHYTVTTIEPGGSRASTDTEIIRAIIALQSEHQQRCSEISHKTTTA